MKSTDIAMLILIVSISLFVSYFIGNALFAGDQNRSTEVEVAQPISIEFPATDPKIFNKNSLNLTEKIDIGDTQSDKPFSSGDN